MPFQKKRYELYFATCQENHLAENPEAFDKELAEYTF